MEDEPDPEPKSHQCDDMKPGGFIYKHDGIRGWKYRGQDGYVAHTCAAPRAHCEWCGRPLDGPDRDCANCGHDEDTCPVACSVNPLHPDWQPKPAPPSKRDRAILDAVNETAPTHLNLTEAISCLAVHDYHATAELVRCLRDAIEVQDE